MPPVYPNLVFVQIFKRKESRVARFQEIRPRETRGHLHESSAPPLYAISRKMPEGLNIYSVVNVPRESLFYVAAKVVDQ